MPDDFKIDDDEDAGQVWRELRKHSQDKRAHNREQSAKMLRERGIAFQEKNAGTHLIITRGDRTYDFWPGTGKWIQRGGPGGRGVRMLLKKLESGKQTG